MLSELLCPRQLTLVYCNRLAGHPWQNHMFYSFFRSHLSSEIAVDIAAVVWSCHCCARIEAKVRNRSIWLKLFPTTTSFEAADIDYLGLHPQRQSENQFFLVMTDCSTKLAQVSALAKITARIVAAAFYEVSISKYGMSVSVVDGNGKKFASKLFQSACRMLGTTKFYT